MVTASGAACAGTAATRAQPFAASSVSRARAICKRRQAFALNRFLALALIRAITPDRPAWASRVLVARARDRDEYGRQPEESLSNQPDVRISWEEREQRPCRERVEHLLARPPTLAEQA